MEERKSKSFRVSDVNFENIVHPLQITSESDVPSEFKVCISEFMTLPNIFGMCNIPLVSSAKKERGTTKYPPFPLRTSHQWRKHALRGVDIHRLSLGYKGRAEGRSENRRFECECFEI
jgi:hypothetical protein